MKKLLLIIALCVGGLSAQQSGSYYGWTGSYGPVLSSNSPVAFYNSYTLPGEWTPQISSSAYCVNDPFPNAYLQFAFQMVTGCPEGAYMSESASNGFPFVAGSIWNTMVETGNSLDGANQVPLEYFEWTYDCQSYYYGPTYYSDPGGTQINPCQT